MEMSSALPASPASSTSTSSATDTAPARGAAKPRYRFTVLTDEDIEEQPDPDWLVEGVLPARSLSLLYGAPASGKTFTPLSLGYAVATASAWAGRATTAGAVVYAWLKESPG
jgi:hypothetical protein